MAVLGVGVGVEVQPLVQEALAMGVDQDAERIVVLLGPIADAKVALGRRVHVPLHGVCAGPVAGGGSTDIDRHAVAPAHVEAGAAHLRQVVVGPQVAGTPFRTRFEPAAGGHHGFRRKAVHHVVLARADAVRAASSYSSAMAMVS